MKITGNNSIGKSNDRTASNKPFRVSRLFLATSLFLLLAGSTPGAVGSCSKNKDDATLDASVVPAYCEKIELYLCAREYARSPEPQSDEATAEYKQCTDNASYIRWCPNNCMPTTKRRWDACFRALESTTTLDKVKPESIPECHPEWLCKTSAESHYDAGESDAGDDHDN